jgi:hypothetical protein
MGEGIRRSTEMRCAVRDRPGGTFGGRAIRGNGQRPSGDVTDTFRVATYQCQLITAVRKALRDGSPKAARRARYQ